MPWKEAIAKITKTSWDKKWTAYLNAIPADRVKSPSQLDTGRKRSQLHTGLSKPMSALITQIRTEKIGLNAFLADRRVPGYTAACTCGWPRQTAKHILMYCRTTTKPIQSRRHARLQGDNRNKSWAKSSSSVATGNRPFTTVQSWPKCNKPRNPGKRRSRSEVAVTDHKLW